MDDHTVAEAGVRSLHAAYADAIWRKDYAAAADCYTADGEWRNGGLALKGRQEIASALETFMVRFDCVFMTFRNPVVWAQGDEILARTYITEQNVQVSGEPRMAMGVYFDRIVRDGGVWRRRWSLFQLQYRGPGDFSGTFFRQPDYGPPPGFPALDAVTVAPDFLPVLRHGANPVLVSASVKPAVPATSI